MPEEALTNLPHGSEVLIDANIFVYALLEISAQCVKLQRRCSNEEVLAVTTADVVSDVCHRLMLAEAVTTRVISRQSAPLLKGKRDQVRGLSRYWHLTAGILGLDMLVLELDESRLRHSHEMRVRYGLLAAEYGIRALASRDSDFDNIEWLTVYKPTDVP